MSVQASILDVVSLLSLTTAAYLDGGVVPGLIVLGASLAVLAWRLRRASARQKLFNEAVAEYELRETVAEAGRKAAPSKEDV